MTVMCNFCVGGNSPNAQDKNRGTLNDKSHLRGRAIRAVAPFADPEIRVCFPIVILITW